MPFYDNFAMACANQCVTSEKQTSVWTFLSQQFRGFNQLPSRAPTSVMRDNDYANMMSN